MKTTKFLSWLSSLLFDDLIDAVLAMSALDEEVSASIPSRIDLGTQLYEIRSDDNERSAFVIQH